MMVGLADPSVGHGKVFQLLARAAVVTFRILDLCLLRVFSGLLVFRRGSFAEPGSRRRPGGAQKASPTYTFLLRHGNAPFNGCKINLPVPPVANKPPD